MKTLFITTALLLLVAHQAAAAQKSDRDRDELTGPVRSVENITVMTSQLPGREPTNSQGFTTVTIYDANGRMTEQVIKAGSRILNRYLYSYDASGNRIEEIHNLDMKLPAGSTADAPKKITRAKTVIKYDDRGNIIEKETRWKGESGSRWVRYAYDSDGRLKEEVTKWPEATTTYAYADKSLPVESTTYFSKNEIGQKQVYVYEFDSKGSWVKRTARVFHYRDGKAVQESKWVTYRKITYATAQGGVETTAANDMPAPDEKLAQMSFPKIIRKSGGVLQNSATKKVRPNYPIGARAKGVSGSVVVELTLDEEGNVISTRVVSGPDELRDAAVDAAKQWKFKPTQLSGVPVKVIGTITFNFSP